MSNGNKEPIVIEGTCSIQEEDPFKINPATTLILCASGLPPTSITCKKIDTSVVPHKIWIEISIDSESVHKNIKGIKDGAAFIIETPTEGELH